MPLIEESRPAHRHDSNSALRFSGASFKFPLRRIQPPLSPSISERSLVTRLSMKL